MPSREKPTAKKKPLRKKQRSRRKQKRVTKISKTQPIVIKKNEYTASIISRTTVPWITNWCALDSLPMATCL